jgi:hypothetical protein
MGNGRRMLLTLRSSSGQRLTQAQAKKSSRYVLDLMPQLLHGSQKQELYLSGKRNVQVIVGKQGSLLLNSSVRTFPPLQ